jgi:opacity protein-like surface antigen
MRFFAAFVFAVAMAVALSSAHAQDQATMPFKQGSYAILEGGANFNAPTTTYNGFAGVNARTHLTTGAAVSGAGGYKWSNGLRAEGEFSYHRNTFQYLDTPANPFSGRQISLTFMANAIYELSTGSRITPYIGGGVGVTMAWLNKLTQLNFGTNPFRNTDSTRFAYQGIAGVAIAIAPQWDALMDVRYRVSDGHHFKTLNVLGSFNSLSNYNIHDTTVMGGLRYAF